MANIAFIVNPAAGSGACKMKFKLAAAELDRRGIAYQVYETQSGAQAIKLARRALDAGASCLVAVGGDGTVRELISIARESHITFCIFPFGTGNDFAKALSLPLDPYEAVDLLLNGCVQSIDAATANGATFLNVSGFGFDVEVLQKTELYRRKVKGKSAYFAGLLHALVHLRALPVTVVHENGDRRKFNAAIVSIGNGKFIGGGMPAHPNARTADGQLEVCIIHSIKGLRILPVLLRFFKGRHLPLPETYYFRASSVQFETETPYPVQLDGDIIEQTPLTINVIPKAIRLILPTKTLDPST